MKSGATDKVNLLQAVNRALHETLQEDPSAVILGQDIGKFGGVFRATDGLLDSFGESRVLDTPLAEAAIVGCAIGMAVQGLKPIAEIQFSGFVYQAFHQIEQHLARLPWRSRGVYPLPLVLRMPHGGGVRAFEHHSESRESYFLHTPGLKVVMPATPNDAYGLLKSAFADPDPVIFLEPIRLYRGQKETLSSETIPLGKAKLLQNGDQLTLITYGSMVPICQEAIQEQKNAVELIDLRSLCPLDEDAIFTSVRKTGRVVIVHEAAEFLGLGAEIAARIQEQCFLSLKAPIARVTGFDIPMPYYQRERYNLPDAPRILAAIEATLNY